MTEKDFCVTYTGDYFVLRTHVSATDEEQAVEQADQLLMRHYGLDMKVLANDVEAEVE